MSRIRTAALLIGASLTLAACGVARIEGQPAPVAGQRCVGMPDPVCGRLLQEARAEVVPGAGALVGIEIRCLTVCSEASGDASITRTYANGQTLNSGVGWAGPLGPAPAIPGGPGAEPTDLPVEPACHGIDDEHCTAFAAALLGGAPPEAIAVAIDVRCTGTCTAARGDGVTTARFADGTTLSSNWSYQE